MQKRVGRARSSSSTAAHWRRDLPSPHCPHHHAGQPRPVIRPAGAEADEPRSRCCPPTSLSWPQLLSCARATSTSTSETRNTSNTNATRLTALLPSPTKSSRVATRCRLVLSFQLRRRRWLWFDPRLPDRTIRAGYSGELPTALASALSALASPCRHAPSKRPIGSMARRSLRATPAPTIPHSLLPRPGSSQLFGGCLRSS